MNEYFIFLEHIWLPYGGNCLFAALKVLLGQKIVPFWRLSSSYVPVPVLLRLMFVLIVWPNPSVLQKEEASPPARRTLRPRRPCTYAEDSGEEEEVRPKPIHLDHVRGPPVSSGARSKQLWGKKNQQKTGEQTSQA